jgi:hypothetical protein
MRKLIDEDGNGHGKGIGADLDLLLKSSRNVPKNSSFLKRDLVNSFSLCVVNYMSRVCSVLISNQYQIFEADD